MCGHSCNKNIITKYQQRGKIITNITGSFRVDILLSDSRTQQQEPSKFLAFHQQKPPSCYLSTKAHKPTEIYPNYTSFVQKDQDNYRRVVGIMHQIVGVSAEIRDKIVALRTVVFFMPKRKNMEINYLFRLQ